MADWDEWLGKTETREDDIVHSPARRLAATIGDFTTSYDEGMSVLPPLWHWIYFLDATPHDGIGVDGHPAKGGFLPPIPLPRRMFAGGRFTFPGEIAFGRTAQKHSRVVSVAEKQGRSGKLAFVTVRHEIHQGGKLATTEEHDIVYRASATPGASPPPSRRSERAVSHEETITPDEVMLFRFSALTFNGHRIHYDYPYVTGVEGYPGLIVHGPLIAMLLFEAARRDHPKDRLANFEFRALSPFFCGPPLRLVRALGDGGALFYEARTAEDALVMSASAAFE